MNFPRKILDLKTFFLAGIVLAVLCGIVLRFYNLTGSGFFFYDEGLYLNEQRPILEFIHRIGPLGAADAWKALHVYAAKALATGKTLWYFIIDSRFLWGGLNDWSFAKVAAAMFGLLAFPLTFLWARRFYASASIGLLAMALLAVLPGHVFYSRLGLQEALSTVLVLAGLFFYFFPKKFGWKTFLAGLLFAAAFFSNYRLIMLPVILTAIELWTGIVQRQGIAWRKYLWCCLTFGAGVILVGNLYHGANTTIVAAWVFHQQNMADAVRFDVRNFLSYPYYFFRLENAIFAVFFLGNIYLAVKKRWDVLLPFVLVCVQAFVFSLTSDKATRYLAVMLPLAALAAAFIIRYL